MFRVTLSREGPTTLLSAVSLPQSRQPLLTTGHHKSPHNERPNKVAAAEGGGHLVGWAAKGRPLLCGDLWIPTRCSTGQCCPPLVSTCTTYYTLLVVFPSISYGREVPRYTVHILCQSLCIWGPSYHEGRRIHPVPKTMYWMSLVSRRTANTQLSTPQNLSLIHI